MESIDEERGQAAALLLSVGAGGALRDFVTYYNNERYHESLDNVTPAEVYYGRHYEVISERKKIKRITMQKRKKEYLTGKAV